MHTLIPYAAPPAAQCQQAMQRLQLPHLQGLLQHLTPLSTLRGKPDDLSPLHERVLARTLGLEAPDGLLPWAAFDAHRLGLTQHYGFGGWAWVTPCHWEAQTNHIHMHDPHQLALPQHDADALLRVMQPYFAEDGITLFAQHLGHSHTSWLAHGISLTDLPTASLERVAGQQVDSWMPNSAQAKTLRRLQSEMQMLLYTTPVNDARAAYHLPAVNSFWVSGTGTLHSTPSSKPSHTITLRDSLRSPALHDDATVWLQAWEALDGVTLAHELQRLQSNQPVQITLCGPSHATTLHSTRTTLWSRLRRRWQAPQPSAFLATLL